MARKKTEAFSCSVHNPDGNWRIIPGTIKRLEASEPSFSEWLDELVTCPHCSGRQSRRVSLQNQWAREMEQRRKASRKPRKGSRKRAA